MQIIKYPPKEDWNEILSRPTKSMQDIEQIVMPILEDVKANGDVAIKKYSKQFDGIELNEILVSTEEVSFALTQISEELKEAIKVAYLNIFKLLKRFTCK